MFANPLGLLALLGIPAVLAIHFLQRKSVVLPVSTLFLLERTQREATSGRRFERLLPSVPLWMQILAILLLAWFLAEPRFQKANSVQRVVVVVDSSASMTVFKEAARKALAEKLPGLKGSASTLELTLLPSVPAADRLYAGTSTDDLVAAFSAYTPDRGLIDPSYSLRLARSIVSNDGIVIYLTDTPAEQLPYEALLLSVGRKISNVGFTGLTFEEREGALTWQAIIRNYSDEPAERAWSLETENGATEPRTFAIAPNGFTTIQAAFPKGAENVRVVLTPDDFTLDDTLPMVAPKPKTLNLFAASSPAFRDLTEKLLRSLHSTQPSTDAATSDLLITSYDPLDPTLPDSNAILFVEDPTSVGKYLKGGILAESHPLMDGVNWQALLVRETLDLPRLPNDRVLLWQEKRPLIFFRENAGKQILCFNFDLRLSNATQQPGFIVLLHRFAESLRAAKVAPESLNLETNQRIQIATGDAAEASLEITATDPSGKTIKSPPSGRTSSLPGFLAISLPDQTTPLLTAAVHFADTREADFSACGTAEFDAVTSKSSQKIHTAADPLARLWLLILLLVLLIAWHFTSGKKRNADLTHTS